MRIVAALGGNALLRSAEPLLASVQRRHIEEAAHSLAKIARNSELIVTHGSGPQVAPFAFQSEASPTIQPYPLDLLGAASAGMIGYLIQQALGNALPDRDVVTVLTEVMVRQDDSAFPPPTKPIGPVYAEDVAMSVAKQRGWHLIRDGGGYRRVVPSPEPREIVQIDAITRLVASGAIVICAGGGGIPSILDCRTGNRVGAQAVIDKDQTAALLAMETHADLLMFLTDVDAVYLEWGTERARPIRSSTAAELREIAFAEGSMAPKIEAACRFVEMTGKHAVVGALEQASELLEGRAGSLILPVVRADGLTLPRDVVATGRLELQDLEV